MRKKNIESEPMDGKRTAATRENKIRRFKAQDLL